MLARRGPKTAGEVVDRVSARSTKRLRRDILAMTDLDLGDFCEAAAVKPMLVDLPMALEAALAPRTAASSRKPRAMDSLRRPLALAPQITMRPPGARMRPSTFSVASRSIQCSARPIVTISNRPIPTARSSARLSMICSSTSASAAARRASARHRRLRIDAVNPADVRGKAQRDEARSCSEVDQGLATVEVLTRRRRRRRTPEDRALVARRRFERWFRSGPSHQPLGKTEPLSALFVMFSTTAAKHVPSF